MIRSVPSIVTKKTEIRVHDSFASSDLLNRLDNFQQSQESNPCLSEHPASLNAVARGLNHRPFFLEAVRGEQTCGFLGLAYVRSFLFGRFLVSLPYLNYGGVQAEDEEAATMLIDKAVDLADNLQVRNLELRHVTAMSHPSLTQSRSDKVHMRLELENTCGKMWDKISGKVRNQVRKAEKQNFSATWGGENLLQEYYAVFSRNMRDLGTPVFGKKLFASFLREFPNQAELCVVRDGSKPIAAAILLHGRGITEVPSASSLHEYNPTCANMLLYWNLLQRTIERGQQVFDFGRSSPDSSTYKFKKQWGAEPLPAQWQYYVREGDIGETRRDNPRYERMIRMWKKLPLWVTRWIGPVIVRGIP